jgi:hypothetical protein
MMTSNITFIDVLMWFKQYFVQILVIIGIFVEITPIKVNPISMLLNLIFKPLRKDMDDMKKELNENIQNVETNLKEEIDGLKEEQSKQQAKISELIISNEMNEISKIRWEILEFSSSIENHQVHTRDQYRHIKDDNKRYHHLIEKYKLDNGLIDEEMEKINKHYDKHKNSDSVYF